MRLLNIAAIANPLANRADLNRIDLYWEMPAAAPYAHVRVVRREGSYATSPNPATPQEGIVLAELPGQNYAIDSTLKSETTYYYALFPYNNTGPGNTIIIDNKDEQIDPHNRAATMATGAYDSAGQMYALLPALYHRYDMALPRSFPPAMPDEDRQKGQLRRFLDLPGSQLDQLYSFARAALDLHNLDRVDGRLLPLVGQWIAWNTDYSLGFDAQRNEIRNAPVVYQRIGLIPTVEATVKRISGWESRTKEFVHNVFLSNRPERLNLWARQRDAAGNWLPPPAQPFSVNFAYEGRPAAVLDGTGIFWLFYHTYKKGRWDIWFKTSLDGQQWTPSQPFVDRAGLDKHPVAAAQGAVLWVFWDVYDEARQQWRIDFRTQTAGAWSAIQTFADAMAERRLPAAVADNAGGLWLFWLERAGGQWQLRYNRHDGTTWQLASPGVFPLDAGAAPRVEADLWVSFHPADPSQSLWVFWSRQEPPDGEQKHYAIAYRVKQGLDPTVADWNPVRTLPKAAGVDYHDREPATLIDAAGNIELFWSSKQSGSWSVWRDTLDIATHAFVGPGPVTSGPYSQRTPLAVSTGAGTLLLYRSNESLSYASSVYGATETVDSRYAGCTTVDTRNAGKMALRGQFGDFQGYAYDAGLDGQRTNQNWYARDTIGLYLTPDTADPAKIALITSRLGQVLGEFMPVTGRAVFIT